MRQKIDVLLKRAEHLLERAAKNPNKNSFDMAEASAILFVIDYVFNKETDFNEEQRNRLFKLAEFKEDLKEAAHG